VVTLLSTKKQLDFFRVRHIIKAIKTEEVVLLTNPLEEAQEVLHVSIVHLTAASDILDLLEH